jgi:hypothetical protein
VAKQLKLPGVRRRPNSADIKEFVRSRLAGFELRQAERSRRRAERKSPAPDVPGVEQQPLFAEE